MVSKSLPHLREGKNVSRLIFSFLFFILSWRFAKCSLFGDTSCFLTLSYPRTLPTPPLPYRHKKHTANSTPRCSSDPGDSHISKHGGVLFLECSFSAESFLATCKSSAVHRLLLSQPSTSSRVSFSILLSFHSSKYFTPHRLNCSLSYIAR